jgi:hypothetical protein
MNRKEICCFLKSIVLSFAPSTFSKCRAKVNWSKVFSAWTIHVAAIVRVGLARPANILQPSQVACEFMVEPRRSERYLNSIEKGWRK